MARLSTSIEDIIKEHVHWKVYWQFRDFGFETPAVLIQTYTFIDVRHDLWQG